MLYLWWVNLKYPADPADIIDRMREGAMVKAPVLWRSSTPGVDLLGLLIANPNHPLMPAAVGSLLAAGPGGFIEQVAAPSFVAVIFTTIASRRGIRPSRGWIALTLGFASLSLGPFVHIANVNTYIPTPWTWLRYLPVITDARAPSRFAVIVAMGCAVLFAETFGAWLARAPERRRFLLAMAAVLMAAELLPAPRTLYSAEIPAIYKTIAADPRPIVVLELPFGLRDGLSSLGNFTAQTQFFQTFHRKAVFGGYLSRISEGRKERYRRRAVLGALMALSEGKPLTPDQRARAERGASRFLSTMSLGYVVIDHERASPELTAFATQLLGLKSVGVSGLLELFVPVTPPPS